jgi:hypothetical protein
LSTCVIKRIPPRAVRTLIPLVGHSAGHLRRATNPGLGLIRSLAYYRAVFDSLSPEDLQPGYVTYLADTYARRPASTGKTPPFLIAGITPFLTAANIW